MRFSDQFSCFIITWRNSINKEKDSVVKLAFILQLSVRCYFNEGSLLSSANVITNHGRDDLLALEINTKVSKLDPLIAQ